MLPFPKNVFLSQPLILKERLNRFGNIGTEFEVFETGMS